MGSEAEKEGSEVIVEHPNWAVVACIVWCSICCAFAWWSGAKYGVRFEARRALEYIKERDVEWGKLLAARLLIRDREWICLVEQSRKTGRPIVKGDPGEAYR